MTQTMELDRKQQEYIILCTISHRLKSNNQSAISIIYKVEVPPANHYNANMVLSSLNYNLVAERKYAQRLMSFRERKQYKVPEE